MAARVRHNKPMIAHHVHDAELLNDMADEQLDMLITSLKHYNGRRPQTYPVHQQQIHLVLVYITESLLLLL